MKLLLVIVTLLLVSRAAEAANCSFGTITGPTFASYDVYSSTPSDTAGNIAFICVIAVSIQIDLSSGAGTVAQRTLTKSAGVTLNYNLYTDAARTLIWGNGLSGTSHYTANISILTTINVPVYGRIPVNQDVATGAYTDTVIVTMSF